jgi:hypothetical protein
MERISSQNSFKFSPVSVSFRIGGKVESWSELADESHEEASQPVAQATTPAEFYHYFKEYKDSKSVEDPSNAREWNYSDNSGYVGSVVCLIQLHSGRF